MADTELYPNNLKGLSLSFIESIYAIAFELESELHVRGKEVVFQDLDMTAEEMRGRVEFCLNEAMYESHAYALRRVLGDFDSPANDEKKLYGRPLHEVFKKAVENLRSSAALCYRSYENVNYRHLLTENKTLGLLHCDQNMRFDAGESMERLYEQVQQLMDEVRFYNERRDQALMRMETLMLEIKQCKDCPEDFGWEQLGTTGAKDMNLDGPVTQIFWPHRTKAVLQRLALHTVNEAVQFFGDFANFSKLQDTTLLEWCVVVAILRRVGLLPKGDDVVTIDDKISVFDFSVRSYNGLKRTGIEGIDDLIALFANGAEDGLHRIGSIMNLGRQSREEIFCRIGKSSIELDDSLCFPSAGSHVRALDFDSEDRARLQCCGINTVGDLLTACQSENRFLALKHVDNTLYLSAMKHLRQYGFVK